VVAANIVAQVNEVEVKPTCYRNNHHSGQYHQCRPNVPHIEMPLNKFGRKVAKRISQFEFKRPLNALNPQIANVQSSSKTD
jgi:hypothetical protein